MALILSIVSARAETVLRVPVFVTSAVGSVPVGALNGEMAKLGYGRPIPEWIELKEDPVVRARIELIDAKVEWARHVVGGVFSGSERAFEAAPGDLAQTGFETCYAGDPEEVGGLAIYLSDFMYADHFSLWGWRNRSTTVLFDVSEQLRAQVDRRSPALWKSRLRDDSILLLSRITPDGQDLHVSRVKKCD